MGSWQGTGNEDAAVSARGARRREARMAERWIDVGCDADGDREDDPVRQQQFLRMGIGHGMVVVDSAHDAIRELEQAEWDLCFLDHDLGGKVFQESGTGTGFEVCEWLSENRERRPRRVVIHSLNAKGVGAMLEVMGTMAVPLTFAWTRKLEEILELYK